MRVVHKVEDTVKILELSISDDRQKLFARVTPKDEYHLATVEDLVANISAIAPAELLEMDVIKDICQELTHQKGCESRRVARGREPQTGRDGKLVWLVRRFRPGKGSNEEREFADLFTLGLFENIEKGMEIARIYKPANGTPGVDVLGKEIPARAGKPFAARVDKSVELRVEPERNNYTSVIAAIAGYVHDEGDKFAVRDTLVISGNLDWNMGHIDFIGNVRVSGDVQKGFHIKARGSIEIMGGVLGENVLTSQQSITVKGFHQGFEKSLVSAKGDYFVGIAHGVAADIGGNIFIAREARDCQLRSGMAVHASGAAIVGGSVWCVRGLEAKTIGNEAGVKTIIELRNELEVTKEYRDLSENIKKHEAAAAALELHIGPYLKNRQRVPLLKNQFRVKIAALLSKYDEVSQSLERLRDKERGMREAKPVEGDARVSVIGHVYAGAELGAVDARLPILESVAGPVSYRRSGAQGEWNSEPFQTIKRG